MCDWLQDLSLQRRQSSGCTMSSDANELQLITLTVFCCSTQKKSSLFSSSVTNLQEKTVWCNIFHSLAWRPRGRSLLAVSDVQAERAQRESEQPVLLGCDGFNLAVRTCCCSFLQNTDVLKLYISLGFISSCILWRHVLLIWFRKLMFCFKSSETLRESSRGLLKDIQRRHAD